MVTVVRKENKILFQCDECKLKYPLEEIAQQCEAWCRKHKSCNIEIMKSAVTE